MIFSLLPESLELSLEDQMFIVEGKHVRCGNGDLEDGNIENTHVGPGQVIFLEFLSDAVVDESLEGWLVDTLAP